MNILRRACLYLSRKKIRSVLLFLILLTMGLFMLVGLSIRSSAGKAAADMRKSISTGLNLEMNNIPGNEIYLSTYNEDGELVRTLKLPLITESVAEELASIEGVSGFYSEMGAEMLYTGLDLQPGGYTRELQEAERNGVNDSEYIASAEAWRHSNDFRIVQESEYYPYFSNGALELTEGRHLNMDDSGKIIISEELARRNDLKVGDHIDGRNFDVVTGEQYGETYHAEIVGIFKINFQQDLSQWTAEPNILANTVFAPFELRYWGQVQYNNFYKGKVLAHEEDRLLGSITLFVEDPADLDIVEQRIRENEHVDWSYYLISRYDKDYKAAAKPLLSMVMFATSLAVIMIAGALIILSLILAMWMRSRKQEINILKSLGIGTRSILAQLLVEISMITIAAFFAAGLLAGPITHVVGDALTEFTNPAEDSSAFRTTYEVETGITQIDRAPLHQKPLSYTLLPGEMILTFLSMLFVSCGTIVFTFMRMKGQHLLTYASSGIHHWKFQNVCREGEMKAHHRAFLYITRKTGKSVLLLLTLFVMMVLLISGMSVRFASKSAAAQVRERIGGYFKISSDDSKANTENMVNQVLVNRISALNGIKESNVMDACYMDISGLGLKPGKFSGIGDDKAHLTRILGNKNTSLHEYFSLGIFELTEGRHVEASDVGKALISEELAQLNNLGLGDHFIMQPPGDGADYGSSLKTYELEIVGMFAEVQETHISQETPECDMPANFIFTDIGTTQQIIQDVKSGEDAFYSGGAVFFVKDPENLNQLVRDIRELDIFDSNNIKLTVNNAGYQSSMEPLKQLSNISLLMLTFIAVIGVVLLTLILTLWERDRIYEAGILISVGIPKRNLLWQHFLECASIFLVAFCISTAVLLPVGTRMGDWLYENATEKTEQPDNAYTSNDIYEEETMNVNLIESDISFDAGLQPVTIIYAGLAGIFLTGLSTGVAFSVIARHKPKELLTIME
ncbi:MAG: ABC transporter permease [Eubacteriales bacterium]|nr:ABC transporter permease [Eubacteriales bacterium]